MTHVDPELNSFSDKNLISTWNLNKIPTLSFSAQHDATQKDLTLDHSTTTWQMKFNVFSYINHNHFIESWWVYIHIWHYSPSNLNIDLIKSLTFVCRLKDVCRVRQWTFDDVLLESFWCQINVNIFQETWKMTKTCNKFHITSSSGFAD